VNIGGLVSTSDLLSSIGVCVGAAALLALLANRLRQPLILAYLATGVAIGPVGLHLVGDPTSITTVAEMGLILLLFIIGLEIDLKKLVAAGRPVVVAGALQVPICVALGLGFFWLLGFRVGGGQFGLLYLAACMSMSSTLIVVKLLYDKFELDTLAGRITLGVLVFQDLWAVAMLAIQPNLTNPDFHPVLVSVPEGLLLVIWSLSVSRYILPRLFRSVAKSPELVLVSALAWCFFLAGAASTIGLSREMGALIAGISLSTFPYNVDVIAKATNIRDFFVTLFFVALGMQIPLPSPRLLLLVVAAAGFLVLSRLVVVPLLYFSAMGHRASLLPAINLAQISEFSIVIASLGLARGQIDASIVTIVILTFAVTSVTSTYLIRNNEAVQQRLSRLMRLLHISDVRGSREPEEDPEAGKYIVFLGFFRDASSIVHEFEEWRRSGKSKLLDELLVIDFNPNVINELRKRGVACVYGDIAHIDTLHHAPISNAKLVVSTIPDDILRGTSNLRILKAARHVSPRAQVIVTTDHIPQAIEFYKEGADFVYIPRLQSAGQMAKLLETAMKRGLVTARTEAIADLEGRREVLA